MTEKEVSEQVPVDTYAKRLANKANLKRWRLKQRAETASKALQRNGFEALYASDRDQARGEILKRVPESATVGVGGSMTIRELGVLEDLSEQGHDIYDHWKPGLSQDEILNLRRAQLTCDVFLSSVNALTLQGQLVSTDGIGNRICAMTFGPKKVILAVGANKIARNLDAALMRIKEVSAPLALRESGAAIPCVQTGICSDCDSPARLCRATLILDRKPMLTDTTVIVIGEELGF
jgi:hypothetical protein